MATLIQANENTMTINGTFSDTKNHFIGKGQKVQESRTCENGEDVFFLGKYMGVLLFDSETEKQLIE